MATSAMTDSAGELLRRVQAGESECLGELLQLYQNYLTVLSCAELDNKLRSRISPSDIVQETFAEAHRDFPRFRGHTVPEFSAWLRTILVQNLARVVEQHVTTAKRDVRREQTLARLEHNMSRSSAGLEQLLADGGSSPSAALLRQENVLVLADKLRELPEEYRRVVMLRNFQGLPFEEVAVRMERSSGACRMLWIRALARLREMLTEDHS